ncbi:MAG: hypothetical protein IT440_15620 [Phycisphaeraceae bacterium]|nr:hypothetical protein [Phycisphaeraceae bacterium]
MKKSNWQNCYSEQWAGILIPPAFAHPAKISLALVRKIFTHALKNGWINKGDTCLDPFAGIGGVAFGAMAAGLKFVGQELEPHFVELANGMDCTPEKLCPTCKARSEQTASKNGNLFDEVTGNHHFEGNLEFWQRKFGLSGAVILQGDSRRLLENLRGRVECVVSSPPFQDQTAQQDRKFKMPHDTTGNINVDYGSTAGQLGNLPAGNFDAVISSPPYANSIRSGNGIDPDKLTGNKAGKNSQAFSQGYGNSPAQLAEMPEGQFDAVVSSPPFLFTKGGCGELKNNTDAERISKSMKATSNEAYGNSPAQLGAMPEGRFDITVSSPPYEDSVNNGISGIDWNKANLNRADGNPRNSLKSPAKDFEFKYGSSNGQIGAKSGSTFWSAAREIVEQCFLALKPGGHAIWVTKRFVRNGKIVEFSQQWAKLCESVGFKVVCWHHAMLTQSGAIQMAIDGKETQRIKERKSFFRRLAEQKGSPRIDWEDVICMVKPKNAL